MSSRTLLYFGQDSSRDLTKVLNDTSSQKQYGMPLVQIQLLPAPRFHLPLVHAHTMLLMTKQLLQRKRGPSGCNILGQYCWYASSRSRSITITLSTWSNWFASAFSFR